jgi:hypothetical protein
MFFKFVIFLFLSLIFFHFHFINLFLSHFAFIPQFYFLDLSISLHLSIFFFFIPQLSLYHLFLSIFSYLSLSYSSWRCNFFARLVIIQFKTFRPRWQTSSASSAKCTFVNLVKEVERNLCLSLCVCVCVCVLERVRERTEWE